MAQPNLHNVFKIALSPHLRTNQTVQFTFQPTLVRPVVCFLPSILQVLDTDSQYTVTSDHRNFD
jgi:hypothetical protein